MKDVMAFVYKESDVLFVSVCGCVGVWVCVCLFFLSDFSWFVCLFIFVGV